MNLIIFSHSDYSYLWEPIEEIVSNLGELNPIFVCNINNITKPRGFHKYIEYDEKLCYSQRWLHILPQIESKHIIVVHDVCLIVSCNTDKIKSIIRTIDENEIDRCSLNVFYGTNVINSEIPLCKLEQPIKANTYIPFDLCPAIWNRESFIKLWTKFPNENYRQSEQNPQLQNYCKTLKCYGLQKTENKLHFCIGRPYYDFFKILHITIQGLLLYPFEVYMDAYPEFVAIENKYNLTSKINVNMWYGHSFGGKNTLD